MTLWVPPTVRWPRVPHLVIRFEEFLVGAQGHAEFVRLLHVELQRGGKGLGLQVRHQFVALSPRNLQNKTNKQSKKPFHGAIDV